MRVSFSIPLKPLSGKQNFAIRLADSMKKMGVKITDKRPDVNIVFLKGVRKGCKNIYRLDGILMNTKVNYKKKNNILKEQMKRCDGIIYQNEFCKQASDVFIGKFDRYDIINNGAKIPEGILKYEHRKPYVLCFSRWRPHKRLKQIIEGFLSSNIKNECDIIVLGDPDYIIKNESVIYLGHKQEADIWQYILGSMFVVHIAYVDWCPNSVVESIVGGKNVLHSSVGGTRFIVKHNGISVKDVEWNFAPINLENVPNIDKDHLKTSFSDMMSLPSPDSEYLHIDYIAKKYVKYCKEILET